MELMDFDYNKIYAPFNEDRPEICNLMISGFSGQIENAIDFAWQVYMQYFKTTASERFDKMIENVTDKLNKGEGADWSRPARSYITALFKELALEIEKDYPNVKTNVNVRKVGSGYDTSYALDFEVNGYDIITEAVDRGTAILPVAYDCEGAVNGKGGGTPISFKDCVNIMYLLDRTNAIEKDDKVGYLYNYDNLDDICDKIDSSFDNDKFQKIIDEHGVTDVVIEKANGVKLTLDDVVPLLSRQYYDAEKEIHKLFEQPKPKKIKEPDID